MFTITMMLFAALGFPSLERPELTMTQGMIESNLNIKAVGKAGEKGAFQVKEKEWGKVPKTLHKQAEQSEDILNELLENSSNDLHTALRKYNGRGSQAIRYANKVRKGTIEHCLLRV